MLYHELTTVTMLIVLIYVMLVVRQTYLALQTLGIWYERGYELLLNLCKYVAGAGAGADRRGRQVGTEMSCVNVMNAEAFDHDAGASLKPAVAFALTLGGEGGSPRYRALGGARAGLAAMLGRDSGGSRGCRWDRPYMLVVLDGEGVRFGADVVI